MKLKMKKSQYGKVWFNAWSDAANCINMDDEEKQNYFRPEKFEEGDKIKVVNLINKREYNDMSGEIISSLD